jgi:hypothetical protein
LNLFKTTGPNHEEMVKQAFLPLMSKLVSRAGQVVVKHPLKSAGAGLATLDSGANIGRMSKSMSDAASGGHNIASRVGAMNL